MRESATNQPQASHCAGCGKPLTRRAPEGLCAACLLGPALALATQCGENDEELDLIAAAGLEGRTLGGYEILSTVARGGMGVVFRARQKNPSRIVALKVISAGELATRRMVERFHNEARAAARLNHPNIVPIHEVGEDRGWHFFSMQLIEGGTLGDALRDARPFPPDAARLLIKIARAVEHAHQRGILHRDLKPTNILLDGLGEPHLTDFGLAKVTELDSDPTHTQAVMGTPAYMSPEQATGRGRDITTATDVYGLGAMFYEMLAGRPPFRAETTPALLRIIAEMDPEPLRLPGMADLEVICLKCLEKEPARRYATAGELADELGRWLRHEPILARPAGGWERAIKWVRRKPALAALTATVVMAGLLLTTVSLFFNFQLQRAGQAVEHAAQVSHDQLVAQHLREAGRATAAGDGLVGLFSLTEALRLEHGNASPEDAIRRRIGLALRHSPELLRIWDAGGAPVRLQFSSDNRRLVCVLRSGALRVWDLPNGTMESIPLAPGEASHGAVISQSGCETAESLAQSPYVRLRHLDRGTVSSLPLTESCRGAMKFSGSGRWLVTAGKELRIWETAGGAEVPLPVDAGGRWARLTVSPDDQFILALQRDGTGRLLETRSWTWRDSPWLAAAAGQATSVFSADGRWLLLATDAEWVLVATDSGARVFSAPHSGLTFGSAFSPDGKFFATAGFRDQARVWALPQSDGDTNVVPYRLPIRHETGANQVFFSPDGRLLATAGFDYQLRLHHASRHHLVAPVLHHTALIDVLAFSADGRFLASGDARGMVRVWDLQPRGEVALPGAVASPEPSFTPDGKHIVARDARQQLRLYDAASGRPAAEPLFAPASSPDDLRRREASDEMAPASLAWGGDGKWLAAALGENGVRLWEFPSWRLIAAWTNIGEATSVAFDPAGKTVTAGTTGGDVLRWNLSNLQPMEPWHAPFVPVLRLAWSPHGSWLATGGKRAVQVLKVDDGIEALPLISGRGALASMTFSPDGRRLLTAAGNDSISPEAAHLWSLPSLREEVPPLEHGDGVASAVFSPDGQWVATGGEDNVLRLWRANDGAASGRALRHEGIVLALRFHPSGDWLAAGGNDGRVRIWSTPAGELAGPAMVVAGMVTAVAFAPDGGRVLAVGDRTNALLMPFTPESRPVEEVERLAQAQTALRAAPGGTLEQAPLAALARDFAKHQPPGELFTADAMAWHERMAGPAEDAGEWFTAEFHLRRLLALRRDDAVVQQRLERARVELNRRTAR